MTIPRNCLTCEYSYSDGEKGIIAKCDKYLSVVIPSGQSGYRSCNFYKQAEKLCAKCIGYNHDCCWEREDYETGREVCWAKKCKSFTPIKSKNCTNCKYGSEAKGHGKYVWFCDKEWQRKFMNKSVAEKQKCPNYEKKTEEPIFKQEWIECSRIDDKMTADRKRPLREAEEKDIKQEIEELEKKVEEAERDVYNTLKRFKNSSATIYVCWLRTGHIPRKDFIKFLRDYKNISEEELKDLKVKYYLFNRDYYKKNRINPIKKALAIIDKYSDDYDKYRLKVKLCELTDCYKKLRPNTCPECKAEFPKDANFCPQCGSTISN